MISRGFVDLWEPQYDHQKYPLDFYLHHCFSAQNADQPEELKEHLLALLHWKDGKANAYLLGEIHARPNTVNSILVLMDNDLTNFARAFRDLVEADENERKRCTDRLRLVLSNMWNTVVISAFLLHVARPVYLPMIDQHIVRAWLALAEGKVLPKPRITWELWKKYVVFFQKTVEELGYHDDLKERSQIDRALFTWKKSLKNSTARRAEPPTPPPPPREGRQLINGPSFWSQQVPNTGIIPTSCNVRTALQNYLDVAGC